MKLNYFSLIADVVEESPMMDAKDLQRETDPLDVDPFAFINI